MAELTLKEVLGRLNKEGLNISKRTFEYYQRFGLLPKPVKRVGEKGRGVYGYYDSIVIDIIKSIGRLKKDGKSLNEIKELSDSSIRETFLSVLRDWGFSDYTLEEMRGLPPLEEQAKILEKLLENQENSSRELRDIILSFTAPSGSFEKEFLEQFHWWDSDEVIEEAALNHIRTYAYSNVSGLSVAVILIGGMVNGMDKQGEGSVLVELLNRLAKKTHELKGLIDRIDARLAELQFENFEE